MPVFNASIRLAYWMIFVLFVQVLPIAPLTAAGGFVAWAGSRPGRASWIRLLRRSRWLLVILTLSLVLVTPGEAVFPGFSPTWEGLDAGGHQLIRLIVMLGAVAWLLALTSPEELVGGLLGWVPSGCAALREWATRGALRLTLVLRIVSAPQPLGWRAWMDEPVSDDGLLVEPVRIHLPHWSRADRFALVGLALATGTWLVMVRGG